jgi:hypothetical protein
MVELVVVGGVVEVYSESINKCQKTDKNNDGVLENNELIWDQ